MGVGPVGFDSDWRAAFGVTPPLGFALTVACPDRWVRVHALPGSVRYARDATARKIILDRGNQLGDEMFGPLARLWLVRCVAANAPLPRGHVLSSIDPDPDSDWFSVPQVFHVQQIAWRVGLFDRLLTDIAEERQRALFFDPGTKRVLAPYDGGFDQIWDTPEQACQARARHADWLPANPLGL